MKREQVMQRRAKEYEAKEAMSLELRKWYIHRGTTPAERYALGPTDTFHTLGDYYKKILPLWCHLSMTWNKVPALPPASSFFTLARGGLLDTRYVPIRDTWSMTNQRIYVQDSAHTRDILSRLQGCPSRTWAWNFIKTQLVQHTFKEGWMVMFKQADSLQRRLNRPEWQELLDGYTLNLQKHIKVGELLDQGLMPPDLLLVAFSLLTVRLQDFLVNNHVSRGYVAPQGDGAPRQIIVVHGQQKLVDHEKGQLVEFYRSNLYRAPASIRRPKNQSPLQGW